jgi:hypothetical protein
MSCVRPIYLDPISGNDDNDGSEERPLKTLAAVRLVLLEHAPIYPRIVEIVLLDDVPESDPLDMTGFAALGVIGVRGAITRGRLVKAYFAQITTAVCPTCKRNL